MTSSHHTHGWTSVSEWVSAAHKSSTAVEREWHDSGLAMVPLGTRFDAIRMPAEIVMAAAQSNDWNEIAEYLTSSLDGPVIHDPYAWVYALVPPRTTETWRSPLAGCRGRGSWLGVPPMDRTESAGRIYWAVSMRSAGDLCSAAAVTELIKVGHQRLAEGVSR